MQDHPGAPGSARQRNPGTDGPAACGGAAVPSPQAWDHVRSRAVPLHTPLAPDHVRSGAGAVTTTGPRALALGAGPPSVRCRAHGVARPRWLWPGVRRPECAADHRPLAGSREPAAPGSLAPRSCRPRRSHLPAIPLHHPSSASRHTGADPPAACHRGHGLPTPTPFARPAPARPPTTYSRRLWSPRSTGNVDSRTRERRPPHTPSPHGGEGAGG